ncbi:hypothetical protein [Desulfotomaculum sp. 1211_IL3151]|uniref:hypothetical protein n=1 Tax=Desulfotomaculum sp. 1211_IL3151 TaxID=3084055 RepID=UPI002FD9F389
MKKIIPCILILLLSIALFGCTNGASKTPVKDEPRPTEISNEQAVVSLVKDFGQRLQLVSLQASEDILSESMQKNYVDLVSPGLLTEWQSDPQNAPGREVSSPWPDRIEILAMKKLSGEAYEIKGEIIEITSLEQTKGGFAGKQPINLVVKKIKDRWLIDDFTFGTSEASDAIVYKNTQYGFNFPLPTSWQGFAIVNDQWKGLAPGGSQTEKTVQTGPIIYIRHPQWSVQDPRQDIPIMIFTFDQWDSLQQEKFHIGGAPMGPMELGRNSRYVFALPARYNYAFPTGYEEVETILNRNPLLPTE